MSKGAKSVLSWGIGILIPVALVWWAASLPKIPEGEILSRNGVHWHAKMSIRISGEDVIIPANIGVPVGVEHPANMHTHETDNIIHIEKQGIMTKKDGRVGSFFDVWGKDFSSASILGNAAGAGGSTTTITMLVNGATNEEYENYVMRDGDTIEIVYQ